MRRVQLDSIERIATLNALWKAGELYEIDTTFWPDATAVIQHNNPSAILPGDWPADLDIDRAADACWLLQHGERQ